MNRIADLISTMTSGRTYHADMEIPNRLMLDDHPLELQLTPAARRALVERRERLDVEMKLLFSCFVAKRLAFRAEPDARVAARAHLVGPVTVSYRVMLARTCESVSCDEPPRHETLPVERPQRYAPKWLALDYRGGEWHGDFGY